MAKLYFVFVDDRFLNGEFARRLGILIYHFPPESHDLVHTLSYGILFTQEGVNFIVSTRH